MDFFLLGHLPDVASCILLDLNFLAVRSGGTLPFLALDHGLLVEVLAPDLEVLVVLTVFCLGFGVVMAALCLLGVPTSLSALPSQTWHSLWPRCLMISMALFLLEGCFLVADPRDFCFCVAVRFGVSQGVSILLEFSGEIFGFTFVLVFLSASWLLRLT